MTGPPPTARLHELPPEAGGAFMTSRGPVVIDWCNARPGEPDLDPGLTALILAQVAAAERVLACAH
ncbi:hypothetical protein ACIBSW_00800 [Actinoplanes sp. NPDC049668]|uniref:hypothetical protein n=1 Tax=unclassified Actinoplanes TaxID=2626549 RepID=UPI0033A2CE6E